MNKATKTHNNQNYTDLSILYELTHFGVTVDIQPALQNLTGCASTGFTKDHKIYEINNISGHKKEVKL